MLEAVLLLRVAILEALVVPTAVENFRLAGSSVCGTTLRLANNP